MLKAGVLGKKLGHSYSPMIHSMLGDYEYTIYERSEEELKDFVLNGGLDGFNVTIPYKKAVIPYLNELSESAKSTGSVNTVIRRSDGTLIGDNTDVYGFYCLVKHSGIDVKGAKTLVLGNGGAAPSVCAALTSLGAIPTIISRSGENNYTNLYLHKDAKIIVNTTPLGMYPNVGDSPVDLTLFPNCVGVFDIVYNPSKTALLLQAESLGIPCANGLYMLVAQAKRASELFTGLKINDDEIDRIDKCLSLSMRNVILIGMPSCGKTTISKELGLILNREVVDTDDLIAKKIGISVPEYITEYGENEFRKVESEVISEVGKQSGKIISTGGGCITRDENYVPLHQNGTIVWLKRDINKLSVVGRPLSQKGSLDDMYKARAPKYEKFADVVVDNNGNLDNTIAKIMEALDEISSN